MKVRVLVFGQLTEVLPADPAALELDPGARVADVLEHLRERHPRAREGLAMASVAVNLRYARPEHELQEGDEVALIPPVSGG